MIPTVVIIGRPNVGKSSLFNLLAKRRISIVDAMPGVTRDRVSTIIDLPPTDSASSRQIELTDTGGHGIEDAQSLTDHVELQIAQAVLEADLVFFVTDAQTGVLPLDQAVAKLLRESGILTPVILIANKADTDAHEATAHDGAKLGFGTPITVSATTGRNKGVLIEAIQQNLRHLSSEPHTPQPSKASPLLAVIGKRNAGKSSFVNALAGQNRVIVSETPGTTRDAVDVRFEIDGKVFTAIDTAGVRKGKSIADDIEFYSHHRTLRSIRRAHVVLLMIDATLPISQVDQQLAQEVLKHHKPCVIVLNKWDLAQDRTEQDDYVKYLGDMLKGFDFAPIAFISAKHSQGVREAVEIAMTLYHQADHRVSTGMLNQAVRKALAKNAPMSRAGRRPKIYYATQLSVHPPTIGLFVNDPNALDASYQRFLINRLRDLLPFAEVPIKLLIRGKKTMPAEARILAAQQSR